MSTFVNEGDELLDSAVEETDSRPDTEAQVNAWRVEQLTRFGFAADTAQALAGDTAVDLHYVEERLLKRGCPLDLARRIA